MRKVGPQMTPPEVKRDERGRILPGRSLNPGGQRRRASSKSERGSAMFHQCQYVHGKCFYCKVECRHSNAKVSSLDPFDTHLVLDCPTCGARVTPHATTYRVVPDEATQPPPTPPADPKAPAVWDLVKFDMEARDATGLRRYGTRLKPGNGRDALMDAYEEALDLVVYLRQVLFERDGR